MGRIDRHRLRESGIPLDMSGPMHAFAPGIGADNGESLQLIPQEERAQEIAEMAAEESDFWKGRSIPIQLMVELPFWLMIPDCEISIAHGDAKVRASIRGKYMAVSDGPLFHDSHCNVVFIGPNDDLKAGKELPQVVARTEAAIYRPMKTVVVFRPEVMEDAVVALQEPVPATQQESCAVRREVRRVNRAAQYLQSVAYAHVPFLNRLITDYRVASRDPFAFQVSQWNVPVWFAEYKNKLVRVCLMPYSDMDWYPTFRRFEDGERSPFYVANGHAVEVQAGADVAPGTLEILDARSLMYRGHVADAVRSAVTAIEVALEGQIAKLLTHNGWTEQQIHSRLQETWNDFDERVADYERISGTRIPGPVLSCLPHINGIRLKSELSRVRTLRHKIVHKGLRVDSHSRGPMVRAIETMTWLFHWLSWAEGKEQEKSRTYVFFEMMRGMGVPRYASAYRTAGVTLLPDEAIDGEAADCEDILWSQYISTIEVTTSDVELFTLMSFKYLGVDLDDGPPAVDGAMLSERFLFGENERSTHVFCLECDALVKREAIEAVASRLIDLKQAQGVSCSPLCIVHHQKSVETANRAVREAVPDDVNMLAKRSGITVVTAVDLRVLVQGVLESRWNETDVKELLSRPGRQGVTPPVHRIIGQVNRMYPRLSVISITLAPREVLTLDDTIGLRLPTCFFVQDVTSLQIDGETVSKAIGPCKVGVVTKLTRADVKEGQTVYLATT